MRFHCACAPHYIPAARTVYRCLHAALHYRFTFCLPCAPVLPHRATHFATARRYACTPGSGSGKCGLRLQHTAHDHTVTPQLHHTCAPAHYRVLFLPYLQFCRFAGSVPLPLFCIPLSRTTSYITWFCFRNSPLPRYALFIIVPLFRCSLLHCPLCCYLNVDYIWLPLVLLFVIRC